MPATTKTRNNRIVTAILGLTLFAGGLGGCTNPSTATKGAGLGALGGGLAGSLIGPSKNRQENALIGAAIGGLLGYAVGNEMDKQDTARLNDSFETSPSYQQSSWVNPDTGRSYAVTPQPAFSQDNGQICREAKIDVTVDGKTETMTKTACRNDSGQWEI
ncbi:MAG: glycine zipper 2TM domain-containing protein [Magnetococcales bacterium]|nr:glycine zipper 2TM domain-containing protein [Magnetococcales bacterium]